MPVSKFPDPRTADPDDEMGLIGIGGDLHPLSLYRAYSTGIFPWPLEDGTLAWFSPTHRAVVDFAHLHIPRKLRQAQTRTALRFSIDEAFEPVITACASTPRPGQDGTWITPEVHAAYVEMHRLGHAHSVEAWLGERLVGGVYGIDIEGAFSAESMFYREPNASKLALLYLIEHLQGRGLDWIDIQVMTPHMQRLGAETMARDRFLERLAQTQSRQLRLFR